MTFEQFYLIASALALAWFACLWNAKDLLNFLIKFALAALTLCGAVLIAKEVLL